MTSPQPSRRSGSRTGSVGEDNVDLRAARDAFVREKQEWEQHHAWEEQQAQGSSSEARRLKGQVRKEQEDEQRREQRRQGKRHACAVREAEREEYLEHRDPAELQHRGQREKLCYDRGEAWYVRDFTKYLDRSEEAYSRAVRDRYGPPRAGSGVGSPDEYVDVWGSTGCLEESREERLESPEWVTKGRKRVVVDGRERHEPLSEREKLVNMLEQQLAEGKRLLELKRERIAKGAEVGETQDERAWRVLKGSEGGSRG
ncbi:hypothetical protein HK104_007894 [Borealophlyctis nickersoniae]|nr:hypothetical protein HK104_007894 [Borealophlyctis nickersoniae]